MVKKIGILSERVAYLLGSPLQPGQPIYLGPSNIAHMRAKHPEDFAQYGRYIELILSLPDYVGENPTDGSIEYVKEFEINEEYVKVAVRLSGGGVLYARSLYVLNRYRVERFIRKGTLKKI